MSEFVARHRNHPSALTLFGKRALDIVLSAVGLVVLAPVLLITAAIIRLDSRGPALFRQVRVGKNGRPFRICKFRTMVQDASRLGTLLTTSGDPRITRSGAVLRRWKIDELPQLFNVLVGQMSFVGPRPEVPEYLAFYTAEQQRVILSMKPGITDYAAIIFRNESELLRGENDPVKFYREQIMPRKFKLYDQYRRDMGLLTDFRLILVTVAALFSRRALTTLQLAQSSAIPGSLERDHRT